MPNIVARSSPIPLPVLYRSMPLLKTFSRESVNGATVSVKTTLFG